MLPAALPTPRDPTIQSAVRAGCVSRLACRVDGVTAEPDPVHVGTQQLGVVVEHLFKVRDGPVLCHRVPGKPAVELVEKR